MRPWRFILIMQTAGRETGCILCLDSMNFSALDDFRGEKKLRKYISDEAGFERIIELYEEKKAGEPLFVFQVTMQNHSGYEETFENFTPEITVEGTNNKSLPMYLSLLRETDRAFEELVRYFSEAEEDTVILFFGDHQPTTYVSNPVPRSNGVNPDSFTEEQNLLRYKVPYVLWSNFDIEEKSGQETSANYLAVDLLESAGLPLPAYQNAQKEIREVYPVISAMQIRDKDGKRVQEKEAGEKLELYRSLQYYLLFDYEK